MELVLKVVVGLLVIALIIIGIMVICLAVCGLWSYIQDSVYDEWGFELPPKKSSWYGKWENTGDLTSDIVPQKVMKCSYCDYKTPTMSRCCPACGTYMKNWDPNWNTHEKEE